MKSSYHAIQLTFEDHNDLDYRVYTNVLEF